MGDSIGQGVLVRPEARIPQSLLASATRYSRTARMLGRDAVAHWNAVNRKILDMFGLKIIGVEEMELKPARGAEGELEVLLGQRVCLSMALSALAVALKGRGDLLVVPQDRQKGLKGAYKEMADLRASATE
ncbi:MAG: hypothetical protein NT099_07885, partial [Candidatus Saganbacteria bacterium]|nr:hypothetical protein [Candidatus Saganbacteria bacterium]